MPQRREAWQRLRWTPQAARVARGFVRQTCEQWDVRAFASLATMIVNELVENALLHTTSEPRVQLELHDEVLTMAVTDDDPAQPVLREGRRESGLGLHIVAELADAWGSTPTPSGGKVVWAVLTEERLPSEN